MVASLEVTFEFNDLERLQRVAPDKADQALRALAFVGLAYAKQLMEESPATGMEYTRGSVTHVASSPGQAPRPDTATLINSLDVTPIRGGYSLHDGVDYGEALEFGTTDIEPRPFFGPTVVHMQREVSTVFDEFLTK